jgi:putative thiamine transport system permease protein
MAIGFAFLISPSGWIVRMVSPWLTGWDRPPNLSIMQDQAGLALIAGLVIKETPFLFLVTVSALGQSDMARRMAVTRNLGYTPLAGWMKCVLPAIYRQLRLPIYAVLAFSLSVVDMALILAPTTPPPLAVQVFRWARDPDIAVQFMGAAGAVLQIIIVVGAIGLWSCGARLIAWRCRALLSDGRRGGAGRALSGIARSTFGLLFAAATLAILSQAVWALTWRWRFPAALPSEWSFEILTRHGPDLFGPMATTIFVAIAAVGLALILTLGSLENERRQGLTVGRHVMWLLYTPLLVPQIGFLFGVQILLIWTDLDGNLAAVIWAHLLFVLPYTFLALGDIYRNFDERLAVTASALGSDPNRIFWRVRLPVLARPVMIAFAIAFAVSVAQYLPTIFAGAGRWETLTTEAVALSSGGDRRITGLFALVQAGLPLLVFAAAASLPIWLYRNRKAMQVAHG